MEREKTSLVIVRSFGANAPGGICVLQHYQIAWVVIPHPSTLTSLSTDPLRAADQEQADIESFLRDSEAKRCRTIDGHVAVMLGCLDRLAI